MVDGTGRRFVDEAQNYGDVGRAMVGRRHPAGSCSMPAAGDGTPVGPLDPKNPDPSWLRRGDDLAALAAAVGVAADTLAGAVATFNDGAERGEDPEFGAGRSPTTSGSATPALLTRRWHH